MATKTRRQVPKTKAVTFDGYDKLTGEEYNKLRRHAFEHFYKDVKLASLQPDLYAWMKDNGYDAESVAIVKSQGTDNLTMALILARCLRTGMPDYYEAHAEYWESLDGTSGTLRPVSENLREFIDRVIADKRSSYVEKVEEEQVTKPRQKTIQERLRDIAINTAGELEGMIDEFIDGGCKLDSKFKPMNVLREFNVSPQHIGYIVEIYEQYKAEIELAMSGTDPDFKEAYSHMTKIQMRNLIKFYELVIADCGSYAQVKKTERKPRRKKPVTPEKLTRKFKFQKDFAELKLKSEPVTKLVESKEVWIYNTKTRKLIWVVADDMAGPITVKNNALVGFDPGKTVMKTLRKPAEQLKAMPASAPAARKYFKEIKAVEAKFNGRGNEHLVLLKIR